MRYENESLKNQGKLPISSFAIKRDYNFKGLKKDVNDGFLVVDEFGMVDDIHARALMQLCHAKGWKLIAIGDYDQIPSINVGDPHRLLINHGATTCYLQNITRQRENQELLKIVKESVLGSVDNAFRLLNNSTISRAADKIISAFYRNFNLFIKTDSQKMADEINSEVNKRIGINDNKIFASNDNNLILHKKIYDDANVLDIHSGIREIKDKHQRQQATVDEYFAALDNYDENKIAVATLSNSERIALNDMIHQRLIQKEILFDDTPFHVNNGDLNNPLEHDINLSVGDRIICLKNDKNLGVRNGTKGFITDINDKHITFRTDSNKVIIFNAELYNTFDFGYAMTINKLQGATVQKIICNADSNSHMDRNKFYVTVSRAKSDVTILTDDVDKLQKNAQDWCHKVTSDDFIHDLEDEIEENHYKTVGSDYRDEVQRAIDLQHLANVSPAIIAKRNRNKSFDELSFEHLPCLSDFQPQSEIQKNDVKIEVPAKTIDTPSSTIDKSIKPIVTAPKPKPKKIEQKQKPVFSR